MITNAQAALIAAGCASTTTNSHVIIANAELFKKWLDQQDGTEQKPKTVKAPVFDKSDEVPVTRRKSAMEVEGVG